MNYYGDRGLYKLSILFASNSEDKYADRDIKSIYRLPSIIRQHYRITARRINRLLPKGRRVRGDVLV